MFSVKKVQVFALLTVLFMVQSAYAFPSDLLSLPPTDPSFKSGRDTITVLEEVEVSAPKLAGKLARTGKVLTLITADQIRASLGKSLGELLQEQVGISVVGARSGFKPRNLRKRCKYRPYIIIDGWISIK